MVLGVGVITLALAPWLLRNYRLTGRAVFISENQVLFDHNNPTFRDWSILDSRYYGISHPSTELDPGVREGLDLCTESEVSRTGYPAWSARLGCYSTVAMQFIVGSPGSYAKLVLMRAIKVLLPTPLGVSPRFSIPLLAANLFVLLPCVITFVRGRVWRHWPGLALGVVFEVAVWLLMSYQLRNRLLVETLMLTQTAAVFSWLGDRLSQDGLATLNRLRDRARRGIYL